IEVLGTRESTTHQAGRPGGHSKRCSKSPARHGLPSIQWVEIPSYLSSEEGLRCDRDHGEYFLPAGFCPFLDEWSELRLAAHLAPELGEAGPAAAAPQTIQRLQAARIAPPVLVVPIAQENADARGEHPAAHGGEARGPGVQVPEREPGRQARERSAREQIAVCLRGAPAQPR